MLCFIMVFKNPGRIFSLGNLNWCGELRSEKISGKEYQNKADDISIKTILSWRFIITIG